MLLGNDKYFSSVHPCDKGKGPCENDGVCEKNGSGFKCKCNEDFTGDKCEKKGKRIESFMVQRILLIYMTKPQVKHWFSSDHQS